MEVEVEDMDGTALVYGLSHFLMFSIKSVFLSRNSFSY